MNKVKIVSVLTPISSNGGGENLLKDLCGFYERNGIEHEVLLLTASRPFEALLRENDIVYKKTSNIELSTTPSKLSYLAAFIKLLFYLHKTIASIKKYKPDVVVVHGFPGSFLIGIGTMLMGKNYKLVYVHHSFKSKESNVLGIIYQAVLNQYDQIVGVSSLTCQSMADSFPKLSRKIMLIPNTINTKTFDIAGDKKELRKKLGLPDGILGVTVARFAPGKNHEFLVRMYGEVSKKFPNFYLVLVGDGKLRAGIENEVRARGFTGKILFVGYQEPRAVAEYLKASDIFIFPSLKEGFGIVVLEAMASGLPVVIFRDIYVGEFGDDVAVAGNEKEFTGMIEDLIVHENKRISMGNKLKEFARSTFDIETIGNEWLDLFRDILKKS